MQYLLVQIRVIDLQWCERLSLRANKVQKQKKEDEKKLTKTQVGVM